MDIERLNYHLGGYTVIVQLVFRTNLSDGVCSLVLDLAEDEQQGSEVIQVECEGIANLQLKELGGGISQFCGLRIKDVSSRQWDRIVYEVSDEEHGRISFLCRDVIVSDRYRIGER
jgi:hypothetical protein